MGKINPTSFNLPEDLKQRFKVAVAQRGTDQSAVVREAIEKWITSTSHAPELKPNPASPTENQGLPPVLRSTTLKGTRLALYRDLAAKVAEVIEEGSSDLVAILAKGIRWAHADLRPLKSGDTRANAHPPRSTSKRHGT